MGGNDEIKNTNYDDSYDNWFNKNRIKMNRNGCFVVPNCVDEFMDFNEYSNFIEWNELQHLRDELNR